MGDVTLFRLYTGELRNGDEIWNAEHEHGGKAQPPLDAAGQGADRGRAPVPPATSARSPSSATPTPAIPSAGAIIRFGSPPIPFPEAVATSAVLVKQRGEEDKLAAGLHKLHEEDPTFHFEYSSELGQTLIHGMGERHFDTILHRLEREVRRARRADPPARRVPRDDQGQGRGTGQAQEAVAAAAVSTATAGSGWHPARAARATNSSTRSWAA